MTDGESTEDRRPVTVRPLTSLALWALIVFLVFRFFTTAQFVLLGGLMTAALASTLQPVADRLPGPASLRAMISVFGALLLLLAALFGAGWLLYGPVQQSIKSLPMLWESVERGLGVVSGWIDYDVTVAELGDVAGRVLTRRSATVWAANVVNGFLTVAVVAAVVIIGAAFVLAHPRGYLLEAASRLLPPARQRPTQKAFEKLQHQLRWWVLGTFFSMMVIGTISGVGFWIIGLKYALPLAVLAGLLQAVPTFGPIVTLALAMFVAATQGLGEMLGVAILYVMIQIIESNLLTPLVMKKAVRIPPIVTLFTIIVWGNVFGVAGLVLAIPINLTIWALLDEHLIRFERRTAEPDAAS
jgi:predicted PurR-regulated permease PerM